jgi:hypothetical protein
MRRTNSHQTAEDDRVKKDRRSTFALRATADNLRVACQPKLMGTLASVSEGWCGSGDSNPR